jgi:MoaA/NifB/PqqE/SkfB family radical SAM enzyme
MQLGLLLTFHCNARCEHCLVNAGPDRNDLMDEADVYSYVDQAAAIPYGTSSLCLSGGEVFLYYSLLERIIRYAAPKFKSISVITNAYWAKTQSVASRKLAPLKAAGLDVLVVSASPFHSQFVDPARAGFALAAANELGLRTFIKCTRPNNGCSAEDIVRAMGPGAGSTDVQHMSLLPGGRASNLPPPLSQKRKVFLLAVARAPCSPFRRMETPISAARLAPSSMRSNWVTRRRPAFRTLCRSII